MADRLAPLALNAPEKRRDRFKRYGLALALASLSLLIRGALPDTTGIYQVSLAAVLLSGWFGGRGPGLFALLICATGILYWFIPPADSFSLPSDYAIGFGTFICLGLLLTEFSGARRRVEQALRASEERFRALVQFSFDVWYWETDAEHRFTRLDLSDWPSDAPVFPSVQFGKTRWEHPYVDLDEHGWREHRATIDAHLPFRDFVRAIPTADGASRYHAVSGLPVFDEAGRFVGYRGVGRDITARKRAEAERRQHVWFLESMDRVNRAMQASNDVERMMSEVLEAVLEVFACDRAWVLYPCDPHAPSWRAVMEHTRPEFSGAAARGLELPMSADSADVARAALECERALPAGPGHERQVKPEIGGRFGVRSEMLMALRPKGDRPYLFGLHQCSRARSWTEDEQRLFEEIGHRLTDALGTLIAFRSLRESEARLERAQRLAHVGWWERDYESGRVSLSDEACRIFGVQPVDLPHWQDRWLSLIHPEDRQRTAEASEIALRGGPRYDVEYRVVRPDGTVRVVHSQGDVSRDGTGHPTRQFGVMHDVTERRQAEDELSEITERFRVLAESALTGIYLIDANGFLYVNPALAKMYGYNVDEIVGRLPTLDLVCPEDRPLVIENMRRRIDGEVEDLRYEVRGLRKDGSVFPIEVHGRRIDYRGKPAVLGTCIDTSKRKQAEHDLRESEARFRTFVDHATDAFFLLDEQLKVVDVNRQACDSLGYGREDLIGKYPRDFDSGLDEPAIRRLAERAASGERITFETRHRRKDGTVFPVEIRTGTFKQAGRLFYLALARDITERRRAEESLRQSETYLAEAQRLSHTGSWALDVASDQYIYTSEESDRIYGFDPQGEPPTRTAVFERIHPDDRSRCQRSIERSLRDKVDTLDEYRIVLPDGTVRHIRAIRHPVLNDAGEVVQLIGTSIDISERKRAEESLRQSEAYLAEAQRLSHTGSWALDVATNKYIYTSYEFDRMYGFDTRAQPLTREAVVERIHPEDRSSWMRTLEKSHREKVDTFHEYRIVLPHGDVRHIHVIRHPVLNDAGEVVQLVGTAIDITERKLAEQALRVKDNALQAARTELARVSRLTTLGELTASIAHEVSQPLGAMTASAGACARWLAAEPPDMREARRALDNIVADGKRAREVIARIRALTKRQAPRMELLDINRKVLEVVALTEHELHSHDIVVRTQLDATLPSVMGDRVQLQQVLLNLIVNAIEAMSSIHDRARELVVVAGRDGDNAVEVEVRDSGTGLDNARAEHLFDAFYTTKAEGLGIGLSISRSIIEAHGGRLWASPNEPHGAVFRFSLPVIEKAES